MKTAEAFVVWNWECPDCGNVNEASDDLFAYVQLEKYPWARYEAKCTCGTADCQAEVLVSHE